MISVVGNRITSKGVSKLLKTLKDCNAGVKKINLYGNELDDTCMESVGEYIEQNQEIESIWVGDNRISDKGIELLSDYLIGNYTFVSLSAQANRNITNQSMPNFLDMASKSAIKEIDIFATSVSEENQAEIQKLLDIPIDKRDIPIKSKTKSAAKVA